MGVPTEIQQGANNGIENTNKRRHKSPVLLNENNDSSHLRPPDSKP